MPVDQNHYNPDYPRDHRQKKKETHFRLNAGALKDFQTTFTGITSVRGMFKKLRDLKAANHLWITTRITQGKITATKKDASDLGTGATDLKDVEASGYKEGKKTTRMKARTKGPQSL